MLDKFLSYIRREYQIDLKGAKLLLAVSGGVDSMVLLDLCQSLEIEIGVVHVDHHTRSGESTKDALFVEGYCAHRSIPFYLLEYQHDKGNFQEGARSFRYHSMLKLLKEHGYHYLCTAHHEQDHLESFLMGLGRGTGLNGIKGVLACEPPILRPLIFNSKESILNYASSNELAWVEDESNTLNTYERNKIRNILLPSLHQVSDTFINGLLTSQGILNKERLLLFELLHGIQSSALSKRKGRFYLNKADYLSLKNGYTALYWTLQQYGFTYDQSSKILSSNVGSIFRSNSHELLVDRDYILWRETMYDEDLTIRLNSPMNFDYLGYSISVQLPEHLDPLWIRKRKAGDVLQLKNGLHKSVKKYLIDQKINRWDKEEVLLLCTEDAVIDLIFPVHIATSNAKKLGVDIAVQAL